MDKGTGSDTTSAQTVFFSYCSTQIEFNNQIKKLFWLLSYHKGLSQCLALCV